MRDHETRHETEQEEFWSGAFGDSYIERNKGQAIVRANIALFSKVLSRTGPLSSIVEFGPNVGLNLAAIHQLMPAAHLHGVEINERACAQLATHKFMASVENGSILSYDGRESYDMAMTKGLLIHVNPDFLESAYRTLYRASRRFIFMCEYYNPAPVSISYRGHVDRLFKRDFAGEFMDQYSDVALVDYGFSYRRDPLFPQDDLTWFLLEKRK